jgi:hypothetical protein
MIGKYLMVSMIKNKYIIFYSRVYDSMRRIIFGRGIEILIKKFTVSTIEI